jgi:di/tricarboxylate transporter
MLIPLVEALQETGAILLIAYLLSTFAADIPLWSLSVVIIVFSMILADVIHYTLTIVSPSATAS